MPPSKRDRLPKDCFSRRDGFPASGRKKRMQAKKMWLALHMKDLNERDERHNQAPRRQDALAEEGGNVHRQAELQPWPHQSRRGGEEAQRCATHARCKGACRKVEDHRGEGPDRRARTYARARCIFAARRCFAPTYGRRKSTPRRRPCGCARL